MDFSNLFHQFFYYANIVFLFFYRLSESNSAWQAQMSDSSESSSDSDDESGDDGEALGVTSTVGPRFANVSGSEAWYLKRNNIKKN